MASCATSSGSVDGGDTRMANRSTRSRCAAAKASAAVDVAVASMAPPPAAVPFTSLHTRRPAGVCLVRRARHQGEARLAATTCPYGVTPRSDGIRAAAGVGVGVGVGLGVGVGVGVGEVPGLGGCDVAWV